MKFLLLTLSLLLFSCASSNIEKNQNILGNWKITDIQNVKLLKDANANMNFQLENKLGGSSSCNRYFATYKAAGESLSISKSGATKKLCFGKLNNYEFLFFQSLPEVESFRVERNYLTLLSKEGKVLFRATRD